MEIPNPAESMRCCLDPKLYFSRNKYIFQIKWKHPDPKTNLIFQNKMGLLYWPGRLLPLKFVTPRRTPIIIYLLPGTPPAENLIIYFFVTPIT